MNDQDWQATSAGDASPDVSARTPHDGAPAAVPHDVAPAAGHDEPAGMAAPPSPVRAEPAPAGASDAPSADVASEPVPDVPGVEHGAPAATGAAETETAVPAATHAAAEPAEASPAGGPHDVASASGEAPAIDAIISAQASASDDVDARPSADHDVSASAEPALDRSDAPSNAAGATAAEAISGEAISAGATSADASADPEAAAPAAAPGRPAKRADAASDAELAALRRRAKESWEAVVAAHGSGGTVLGTVVSTVKGGMLVDIAGIRGFLPASQVRAPEGQTLDALVKTVLPLKVLDLDASRRRAVVSARRALEQLRREKRAEILRSLEPGQRREAVVVRLTDFGAFVDLGGVDGLIPMSELALERVERASDVVTVGDKLEVEVLRVDESGKKISLSRKNALPDAWRDHAALLRPGTTVEGKVVAKEPRLSIEIAPGVVGIMRDSDADPADYELGETVDVAIRTVDRRSRRLILTTPYAGTAALSSGGSGFAPLGQELLAKKRR